MAVILPDIQSVFAHTSLYSFSFPLPVGESVVAFPSSLKEVDINKVQGTITAYLTVYNNDDGTPFIDPYQDIIAPGSFTKTIQDLNQSRTKKQNPWYCPDLWQHDRYELIGGVKGLTEDSKGVVYEVQLAMGVRRAQEAFELAEQKMLGSSYGYDPIRFDILPGNVRKLKEIRLREVSQVTFPANDIAPILGTKQRWSVSHVPQAAILFDKMTQVAPVALQAKAEDFTTAWAEQQPDEMMRQFWRMADTLSMTLLANVHDATVSDMTAMIDTIVQQYSDALKAWYPPYMAACAMDEDEDDYTPSMDDLLDMFMFMSADNRPALKRVSERLAQVKTGKVLSAENKKRISGVIGDVQSALNTIADWLVSLDEDTTGKATQGSNTFPAQNPFLPLLGKPFVSAPVAPHTTIAVEEFAKAVRTMFGAETSKVDAINPTRIP